MWPSPQATDGWNVPARTSQGAPLELIVELMSAKLHDPKELAEREGFYYRRNPQIVEIQELRHNILAWSGLQAHSNLGWSFYSFSCGLEFSITGISVGSIASVAAVPARMQGATVTLNRIASQVS